MEKHLLVLPVLFSRWFMEQRSKDMMLVRISKIVSLVESGCDTAVMVRAAVRIKLNKKHWDLTKQVAKLLNKRDKDAEH